MFRKTLIISIAILAFAGFGSAQTSWLDRPMGRNWNNGDGNVPQAPRVFVPISERCRGQIRTPDSLADRAVTRAGWSLFGSSQSFGQTTVVGGMASTDVQCRPTQYNYFVFVNNRFAGTISPDMMTSRSDGALIDVNLVSETNFSAEFARYRASDPASSPSQRSVVVYRINRERNVVDARTVNTVGSCPDAGDITTQDNVVTGTITYRGRNALPQNAVISVRLLDASRQDTAVGVVAEDRIDAAGKQVPIPFELVYDPGRIQERNRYVIRAEIRDGERLLYTTDNSYPVITQGNPRSVEVTVVQVGGGGFPGGNRQNAIRGSVSYRQRIALGPNSDARVWLVDSGDPNGRPVAETTLQFGNRQVPIDFELPYEMRDINRQRNYEVWAEIRTGGQVRFRTERGVPVALRGGQSENVELIVVPARPTVEPITGQNFDLSKLGAGSMQIEGGSTTFLVGANVNVRSNGDASVRLSRLGGSVTFSGKLTFFDSSTMRITVENSGNANASGEIEVRYNGRSLGAITSRDLVLDGQNVTVRF
jgi:uncharacterized lipoprotein YbaY